MGELVSNRHTRGFTLVELAVVLTIVAAVAATTLSLRDARDSLKQEEGTSVNLSQITEALQRFYDANNYLPCPADGTEPINEEGFGKEVRANGAARCDSSVLNDSQGIRRGGDVWVGAVPVKALNLPTSYAFDPFGRRITYAVIDDYTDAGGAPFNTNQELKLYEKYTQAGSVFTRDDENFFRFGAYVLVSHGRNGHGAYPRTPVPERPVVLPPSPEPEKVGERMSGLEGFNNKIDTAGTFSVNGGVLGIPQLDAASFSEFAKPRFPTDQFDDMVVFMPRIEQEGLVNPIRKGIRNYLDIGLDDFPANKNYSFNRGLYLWLDGKKLTGQTEEAFTRDWISRGSLNIVAENPIRDPQNNYAPTLATIDGARALHFRGNQAIMPMVNLDLENTQEEVLGKEWELWRPYTTFVVFDKAMQGDNAANILKMQNPTWMLQPGAEVASAGGESQPYCDADVACARGEDQQPSEKLAYSSVMIGAKGQGTLSINAGENFDTFNLGSNEPGNVPMYIGTDTSHIAEVITYGCRLSEREQKFVMAYLSQKYNITPNLEGEPNDDVDDGLMTLVKELQRPVKAVNPKKFGESLWAWYSADGLNDDAISEWKNLLDPNDASKTFTGDADVVKIQNKNWLKFNGNKILEMTNGEEFDDVTIMMVAMLDADETADKRALFSMDNSSGGDPDLLIELSPEELDVHDEKSNTSNPVTISNGYSSVVANHRPFIFRLQARVSGIDEIEAFVNGNIVGEHDVAFYPPPGGCDPNGTTKETSCACAYNNVCPTVKYNADKIWLGGHRNLADFKGYVAELVIINKATSDAEVRGLEQYFSEKYDIPVCEVY